MCLWNTISLVLRDSIGFGAVVLVSTEATIVVIVVNGSSLFFEMNTHTYLTGKQFWSTWGFFQGEALALHSAWADPCDYRKRR